MKGGKKGKEECFSLAHFNESRSVPLGWKVKRRRKNFSFTFLRVPFFLYLGEMAKVVKRTLINYKYFQLPFYMGIINHNVFGCAFYTKKKKLKLRILSGLVESKAKRNARGGKRKRQRGTRSEQKAFPLRLIMIF
jgi:hypothetical protein